MLANRLYEVDRGDNVGYNSKTGLHETNQTQLPSIIIGSQ